MLFLFGIFAAMFLGSFIFLLIVLFKNKAQNNKLKEFEFLLLKLHQSEKNNQKIIAEVLHDKLQGDLIAIKNFIFIYCQIKDENDKKEILSNIQLTLEASIINTKKLSHKLMPPLLDDGGFIKAVEYYFDAINKSTSKQFLVSNDFTSFKLSQDKSYLLFRIVEMFCNHVINDETATMFFLVLKKTGIELIDNGKPFALNLNSNSLADYIFQGLAPHLKVLNGELEQLIVDKGNHFVLKIIND